MNDDSSPIQTEEMIAVEVADEDVIYLPETYPVPPHLHLCPFTAVN
ncbi:MAG: hypothetical protein MZV63_25595 [Marinilabiliales bacterium]|nr:hypothetical protein [Marinilabiliales bacterium]